MQKTLFRSFSCLLMAIGLVGFFPNALVQAASPSRVLLQQVTPTPDDLIKAVNDLRVSRGLNPLTPHPILMKVAQDQAYVLADSDGAAGHTRPSGISLTDLLIMEGYPLGGDLSLGGYRAENWASDGPNVQEIIQAWLGDEPHTNTMLKDVYKDIGAGIATSTDEWGGTHYYYVIDCAMPTASGLPQSNYTPVSILTATAFASYAGTPQWMIPISKSAALPNGDVVHEVQWGQTLWTIAIQYGTTINQIKQFNYLSSDTIQPGQKLVVQHAATQSAPGPLAPPTIPATPDYAFIVTPGMVITTTPENSVQTTTSSEFIRRNGMVIVILIISFSVLLAGLGVLGKRKT